MRVERAFKRMLLAELSGTLPSRSDAPAIDTSTQAALERWRPFVESSVPGRGRLPSIRQFIEQAAGSDLLERMEKRLADLYSNVWPLLAVADNLSFDAWSEQKRWALLTSVLCGPPSVREQPSARAERLRKLAEKARDLAQALGADPDTEHLTITGLMTPLEAITTDGALNQIGASSDTFSVALERLARAIAEDRVGLCSRPHDNDPTPGRMSDGKFIEARLVEWLELPERGTPTVLLRLMLDALSPKAPDGTPMWREPTRRRPPKAKKGSRKQS
ncbi:MAG: hypothetical protein KDI51_09405 [Xanthomonadales bacterium]|nr:hypothetical protein [Xanthomonadales bacterium]